MTSAKVRVAAVQMGVELGRPEANLERMIASLREAALAGAFLTAFPECALTGYCFDSLDEARPAAETIPGPSTLRMAEACRELRAHALFGLLERDGDRLYNSSALVGPEGVVGRHRKVHMPYLGIDRFATPGDAPLRVFEAGPLRIGMLICYDGTFPEAPRVLALEGADLIVLPTNWPPGAECTAAYVTNTRALENNVYYMAVNRIGTERGFRFIGGSRICGPGGETLADAPHERAETLYAEVDPEAARRKRIVRVPGKHIIDRFADRRPEMYGKIVAPVAGPRRPPAG